MSLLSIGLGVLGLGFNVLWPLLSGRTVLLIWQGVACFLFTGHFWLLPEPAWTGGWMNVIAGTQCFLAIPFARYPKFRWVYLGTIPLLLLVVWLGFNDYSGAWPKFAAAISGVALGLQCVGRFQLDTIWLRWFILASLPCWFAHNLIMQAWPAVASDIATTTSCLIGLKLAIAARSRGESKGPLPPPASAA